MGILCLGMWFVQPAYAADGINRQINYQGKLLDSTGTAVSNGTYQMKFSLYSAASGGTTLWTASGTTATPTAIPISVQNGLFSVMLGDPSAAGGWQNTLEGISWQTDSLYLGVTIASDSEMSPRKRLGAVPQAFNAEQLQGMFASTTASGGQTVFTFNQTENNTATGTRTTLVVRSSGLSNTYDHLLRGLNDQGAQVFSLNRQGSVTSSGVLAFIGSGTSTFADSVSVGGMVSTTRAVVDENFTVYGNSTFGDAITELATFNAHVRFQGGVDSTILPYSLGYNLGSEYTPWQVGYFTHVTSTYATSTFLSTDLVQFQRAMGTHVTSTTLSVTGSATSSFAGALSASGGVSTTNIFATALTVHGRTTLGLQPGDLITFTGQINSSLIPSADGVPYLGAESARWAQGHFVHTSTTYATSTYLYAQNAELPAVSTLGWTNATGSTLFTSSLEFLNASGTSATTTYLAALNDASILITPQSSIVPVASVAAGTAPSVIITDDRFAYVANTSSNALRFFDIASSTSPMIYPSIPLGGAGLLDMDVQGDYVYTVHSDGSLRIRDIYGDEVGSFSGIVDPRAVSVEGNYAYIASANLHRVYVLNISDVTAPKLASIFEDGAYLSAPIEVKAVGRFVYVMNLNNTSLSVIDAANPYALVGVGNVSGVGVSENAHMVVQGGYAYTVGSSAFRIINVVNASSPQVVGSYNPGSDVRDVAVSGDYAFVVTGAGWSVLDVKNRNFPTLITSVSLTNAFGISVKGREVFVTDGAGQDRLRVYRLPGVETTSLYAHAAQVGGLVVQGDGKIGSNLDIHGSLSVGHNGIKTTGALSVHSSDATSTILGNLFVGTSTLAVDMHPMFVPDGDDFFVAGNIGSATSVYTNGSFVAGTGSTYYAAGSVANTSGGLTVTTTQALTLNANNSIILSPGTGSVLGSGDGTVSLGNSAIRFNGQFLHTTTTNATSTNLFSTNLFSDYQNVLARSTTNIPQVASVGVDAAPYNVYADDDYAIVLHKTTDQFSLFDMTSSTRPVNIGLFNTNGSGLVEGFLQGHLAFFLHSGDSSLRIFDVKNETAVARGTLTGLTSPRGLSVQGRYVYILQGSGLLKIIDIGDPDAPRVISSVSTSAANPTKVVVRDRYAYVTHANDFTLRVYDVSNPYRPTALTGQASVYITDLVVNGNVAYAAGSGGIDIVNVRNPSSPSWYGLFAGGGNVQTMTVAGRYLFAAGAGTNGVRVIDVSNPMSPVNLQTLGNGSVASQGVAVRGRHLFVSDTATNALLVYALPGIDTTSLDASAIQTGVLQVSADGKIAHTLVVGDSLTVGHGGFVSHGALSVAATNTTSSIMGNLTVGTSTAEGAAIGDFVLNGNDLFVGGNIGSASSVYTNGSFIAGGQATEYRGGSILNTSGNFSVSTTADLVVNANNRFMLTATMGSFVSSTLVLTASSTGPAVIFDNTATITDSSWSAYIDRLLVGDDAVATGTQSYAMVVAYNSAAVDGLCIKRSTNMCPDNGGTIYSLIADDTISASNAFDLAESYAVDGVVTSTDVVVFGSASTTVAQSPGVPYDPRIMGVASTRPGFLLGAMPNSQAVALAGRVPTRVSTVNGTIAIGDPLTTSEYPGVAMKATKPGMILGYALESATATSTIEVFVKPGYSAQTVLNTDGTMTRFTDDLVIDARSTASAGTPNVDSWGLTFRGSAWDGAQVARPSFSLLTQVVTPTSSSFVVRNSSSSQVFAIDQLGGATIAGDVVIGGRLYPSARGTAQRSKYIFLDDTSTSTQYIATNADGWQANDSYDFAERYYSPDKLETGDLVIASERGRLHVQRSLDEKTMLMGIVSTRPAFVAGRPDPDTYPIALAGRVPTKVSTMNGAIKVGDPLGPSTIPGVAVKAVAAGPIVGLALENYDAAVVGKIEVFVNPGWWGGPEGGQIAHNTPPASEAAEAEGGTPQTDVTYRGFALIEAGSKRVHVSYDSILSYPNIQVTPRGQVRGGWWTDNYSDIGFDIFLHDEQTRDVTFAWVVQGTPMGARVYRSDGTYAAVDPTTGEAVSVTVATTTAALPAELPPQETATTPVLASSSTTPSVDSSSSSSSPSPASSVESADSETLPASAGASSASVGSPSTSQEITETASVNEETTVSGTVLEVPHE